MLFKVVYQVKQVFITLIFRIDSSLMENLQKLKELSNADQEIIDSLKVFRINYKFWQKKVKDNLGQIDKLKKDIQTLISEKATIQKQYDAITSIFVNI